MNGVILQNKDQRYTFRSRPRGGQIDSFLVKQRVTKRNSELILEKAVIFEVVECPTVNRAELSFQN